MHKIKVYRFSKYNINTDKSKWSDRYATEKAILERNCFPIKETVMEVSPDRVGDDGFLIEGERL